jgi:hypothetical protein
MDLKTRDKDKWLIRRVGNAGGWMRWQRRRVVAESHLNVARAVDLCGVDGVLVGLEVERVPDALHQRVDPTHRAVELSPGIRTESMTMHELERAGSGQTGTAARPRKKKLVMVAQHDATFRI